MNLIKKIDKGIWGIIILFLIWRLGLFIVAYFGYFDLPNCPGINFYSDLHPIFSMWLPYDSTWFIQIAKEGYGFNSQATAFFPLWPMAIFIFGKIFFFLDTRVVAFILANLFTLGTCIMFYKLVKLEFSNSDIAYRSVKYLLIFPMSLFLATSYSEPLFLFLAITSFYFIRQKKWLVSGSLAMGAAAARIVGICIFVPLLIEAIFNKTKGFLSNFKKIISLILVLLGPLLYIFYLKAITGDCLAFLHAQSIGWTKNVSLSGLISLWENIKNLFGFHFFLPDGAYITSFMQAGILIFFIFILIFGAKKIRLSYLIYSLLVLIFPLAGGNLVSMNRFVLAAFPVFMILAFLGKKKWINELITVVFLLLLGLFTVMFVNGYWVG